MSESGCVGVAVACLIECKNNDAASRQFNGKAGLRFAGIDITVDSKYGRLWAVNGRVLRSVE